MVKLYCLRHGEALDSSHDATRPLSERGAAQVLDLLSYLRDHGLAVDAIWHSDLLRAVQTADIAQSVLGANEQVACAQALRPEAEVSDFVPQVNALSTPTLIVSHLPFIPRLVNALVIDNPDHSPIVDCPPAGIVCLERFNPTDWAIRWIVHPGLLECIQ